MADQQEMMDEDRRREEFEKAEAERLEAIQKKRINGRRP